MNIYEVQESKIEVDAGYLEEDYVSTLGYYEFEELALDAVYQRIEQLVEQLGVIWSNVVESYDAVTNVTSWAAKNIILKMFVREMITARGQPGTIYRVNYTASGFKMEVGIYSSRENAVKQILNRMTYPEQYEHMRYLDKEIWHSHEAKSVFSLDYVKLQP